ncbi:ANR family transcriptional regulator [Sodalis sp. (in: enterobacteria)]|uniref:ANR family transcriptional regulator n=1 Tax=Sodalis sp. (in: enterobacteria) TaxID=1898979 RepID=UPI003F3334BE
MAAHLFIQQRPKTLERNREFAEAAVQWGKAAKQAKSAHNMGWALMRKDYL